MSSVFEVKRKSDQEAVVTFPPDLKVGANIDADKLLIALIRFPGKHETKGPRVEGDCCGHNGCCVH